MLLFAAIMKSKALINMYLCYWLTVAIVCIFVLIIGRIAVLEMLMFTLFIFFATPILGIYYLLSNSFDAIVLIIPLCMLLLGLLVNVKFIKELSNEQS